MINCSRNHSRRKSAYIGRQHNNEQSLTLPHPGHLVVSSHPYWITQWTHVGLWSNQYPYISFIHIAAFDLFPFLHHKLWVSTGDHKHGDVSDFRCFKVAIQDGWIYLEVNTLAMLPRGESAVNTQCPEGHFNVL